MDTISRIETLLLFDLDNQQQQYQFVLDALKHLDFSHYIFLYKNPANQEQYYGISNLELQEQKLPIFFSLDNPPLSMVSIKDSFAKNKANLLLWNSYTWQNDPDMMYLLRDYPIMFGVTVPIFTPEHELKGSICFIRDHVIPTAELTEHLFEFKQMLLSCQFTLETEIKRYLGQMSKKIKLNRRQLDILRMLVTGTSTQDVAKALDIQLPTINYHLRAIYNATECNNRTTAVYKAMKAGLLD